MLHTLQTMAAGIIGGLTLHMQQWEGWAVLISAALYGYRRAPLWLPLVVGLIINPMPYGLIAGLAHGVHVGLNAAAVFTVDQIVIAYAGYVVGRLIARFR